MSSQQIVVTTVVLAILAGAGWYLFGTSSTTNDAMTDGSERISLDASSETSQEAPLKGAGQFKDLLALGRNIQCTFSYSPDEIGGEASGTVYVSGSNFRGDFVMSQGGEETQMHVIHRNDTGYTWGETPIGTMAISFKIDEEDRVNSTRDQGFDLTEEVDYDCKSWRVDQSKFVPPSGVEFQDLTQQFEQIQAGEGLLQGAQCSACDNIPDAAAQAQCREALGCS